MKFAPIMPGSYSWITHCCVCGIKRGDSWPLNGSGYCQSCWEHVPAKFRTAEGREVENYRMALLLLGAARRMRRVFVVPSLQWVEERNTWLWRESCYVATPQGLEVISNRMRNEA